MWSFRTRWRSISFMFTKICSEEFDYSLLQESTVSNMSAGRWLLFLDNMTSLEDYFADIHIPLSCEFLVAQHVAPTKEISLTEVFRVHPTRPLQTNLIGTWSSSRGFTWSTAPFGEGRGDLQGALVQAGIYSAVSFVSQSSRADKTSICINATLMYTIKCLFRTWPKTLRAAKTEQLSSSADR